MRNRTAHSKRAIDARTRNEPAAVHPDRALDQGLHPRDPAEPPIAPPCRAIDQLPGNASKRDPDRRPGGSIPIELLTRI